MFELLTRYDWAFFLVFASAVVTWARRELQLRPAVSVGPLLVANSPWVISGIGSFLYPDRDSFGRFDLRLGLLAYALIASVVIVWVVLVDWLFRQRGADLLAASPRTIKSFNLPTSADSIKLMAVACIGGGVLGLVGIVITATQTPR